MRNIITSALLVVLISCKEKAPATLTEIDQTDFSNVILSIKLQREAGDKVKANAYFSHLGKAISAEEAKVIINGTNMPLDSSKYVEVISEGSYVVDVKTPDGINDTEMIPDELKGIEIPDTLILKRSDNGIGIMNLSASQSVSVTSNGNPVKITSVNEGLLVIEPASLGSPGADSLHTISISISQERKSELSNKMRSVTSQLLKRDGIKLKTE